MTTATPGSDRNRRGKLLPRIAGVIGQHRQRRLPHGLISLRFLLPTQDPWIRLHRDLPLAQNPGRQALHCVINFWLLLRWLLSTAWRASGAAVKNLGDSAQALGAKPPAAQRRDILRLALLHTIPPIAYYQYQLWKHADSAIWAYVYDNELPQFHQHHNGNMQGASADLLADKWQFAQKAAVAGLCATPTLKALNRGEHTVLPALLQLHGDVFCKPRFGSASRGAFAAWQDDNGLAIKPLQGADTLRGDAASDTLWQLLANDDYVIQPLLKNHAALRSLCVANANGFAEAITVRVLSRHRQGAFDLFCAYLEIPLHTDKRRRHAFIAVNGDTGMTQTDGDSWHYHLLRQQQPQLFAAATNLALPHWQQIRAQALRAHTLVDDIHIIAWDFVVTPTTAVLLEGNINWRVSVPQMLFGPLLPRLFA